MPDFSRINSFLESYIEDDAGYLQDIYDDARKRGIPVIRKNTRELLKLLILISRPEKILEVGTAVGYSALFMREAASAAALQRVPSTMRVQLSVKKTSCSLVLDVSLCQAMHCWMFRVLLR